MPLNTGNAALDALTDDQLRQFYASGGNDAQVIAQQSGITDPAQINKIAMQARAIAGSSVPTGNAAVQNYFKQYQQNSPGGAYANDFNGWQASQVPGWLSSMQTGGYTGIAQSTADFEPGGIYGPGSKYYGTQGYGSQFWTPDGVDSGAVKGGSQNLGFGGGFSGGGGGGGSYGGYSSSGGENPYLSQMADDIGRRSNQALGTALQGVRGNSVATGGLGGSRQGVAEGVAIGNAQDTLQGNLSNLYGTDWTNGQNRSLQQYGINTNAALTSRGQDQSFYLGNQGQMQNFYTANRGQDLQALGLGAQLYGQGNAGLIGQGQGVYGIGTTQQNAPWGVINNANGAISPYTGFGATNTQTAQNGGGTSGVIGGALAGAQIGKNLGLGGGSSGFTPTYDSYGLNVAGYR